MISEESLEKAVARGLIGPDQARALRMIESERRKAEFEPAPDHERLRFITGFGDIFVVIGLGLFASALGYFLINAFGAVTGFAGLAVTAWLLAEQFSRRRRMALPSIVLLLGFAVAGFSAFNGLFGWLTSPQAVALGKAALEFERPAPAALAALATAGLVGLHYWRFRVPITVAAGVAALVAALFGLIATISPAFAEAALTPLILAAGIGIFTLAMRFDAKDLQRQTRKTDIAFWLHLLAAPMIVHSLIALVFGGVGNIQTGQAMGLIALFLALALLALLIDRRAILVSGLVYAGIAFGQVFKVSGITNAVIPATLLVLGGFILILSAGWQPIRRLVLAVTPARIRLALPVVQLGSPS
ncbi:MAG: hypothetical protein O9322_14085 [Beijerinckiaceae bacterium]|nr:hypothetical protein [Beijerinckiaceae bacterium]MCZ8300477.1 hypothetical protein [Beijerinckiaceae bacterium]